MLANKMDFYRRSSALKKIDGILKSRKSALKKGTYRKLLTTIFMDGGFEFIFLLHRLIPF